MATELENSIRNAAATVAKYIEDIAEMKVQTKYVRIGADGMADFADAKPAAETVIKLDGDSETTVPMREGEGGEFEIDISLLNLHHQNVATTMEYRAKIMDSLLGVLKS